MSQTLHYFIISDSIGETALKVAKSVLVQFQSISPVLHKFNFISNKERLREIIFTANNYDAILFMTIVNPDLAGFAEDLCRNFDLVLFNLIQPITNKIQQKTGVTPTAIAGAQHELSEKYFKRVKAIEFCLQYDDGKDLNGMNEADIILLGISRTGKTPLSIYLGTLGYKVLNIPVLLENDLHPTLFKADVHKIIGLFNDVDTIHQHREKRMREYGMPSGSIYASTERVREELAHAKAFYQQLRCKTLNVANLSIEESASIILDMQQLPVY